MAEFTEGRLGPECVQLVAEGQPRYILTNAAPGEYTASFAGFQDAVSGLRLNGWGSLYPGGVGSWLECWPSYGQGEVDQKTLNLIERELTADLLEYLERRELGTGKRPSTSTG
jgi:hypothetical protein